MQGSSSSSGLISAKLRETCTRSVVGSRHLPKKVAASSFVPRGKITAAPSHLKLGGSAVVAPKQRRDGELKGFEEDQFKVQYLDTDLEALASERGTNKASGVRDLHVVPRSAHKASQSLNVNAPTPMTKGFSFQAMIKQAEENIEGSQRGDSSRNSSRQCSPSYVKIKSSDADKRLF